jgi:hypothetical protein
MSTISSGTTLTTALVQTGDTTGTLIIKTDNGNTTAVTFNTAGAIGIGASPSYGTSGQALISGGSAAAPSWQAVQAFSSGTVMLFRQTAAPTGWTKDTTNFNDSALRVVTGSVSSGGTQGFTTAFASQAVAGSVSTTVNNATATNQNTTAGGSINTASLSAGATTLSTSQIPSHTHSIIGSNSGGTDNGGFFQERTVSERTYATGAQGGGGSHSHSISGSASFTGTAHSHTQDAHNHTASSSFTGTAINLAVRYCDVIFATKD